MYEPEDDSYLILDPIKKYCKKEFNVLEMGTGSGILSFVASKKAKSVTAIDINPEAIKYCKKEKLKNKINNIKFIESNLFSKLPKSTKHSFDLIIFNPPYLPHDPNEPKNCALATCGGKKGYELIQKFLNQVNFYLKPNGKILLLFSSLTKQIRVNEFLNHNFLKHVIIAEKKICFENLFVYLITKNKFLQILEHKNISNIKKLTQGHRGWIFTGDYKKKKVTIKIQRTDIDAKGTVNNESSVLKKLNKYNLGPTILFSDNNYFVYEYIEGIFPLDFFEKSNKSTIKKIIFDLFEQMFTLDTLKLNKEEMHHPVKNMLITTTNNSKQKIQLKEQNAPLKEPKAILIDFERCKPNPTPQNVTQFCQFVSAGILLKLFERKNIKVNTEKIRELAKEYKPTYSRKTFEKILKEIK
ncbi:methyltransferase domain-containing protein [Candidatus Woesearchaeota archaeon]|nr:methyltransferase domain-containing protein [Candidatus Woesearchaeota archaeon]